MIAVVGGLIHPGWIVAACQVHLGDSPPKTTLVPPGPPMTPVSTCLLFMTPGRSEGTRQEDAFTLLARELRVSSERMRRCQGSREHPQEHVGRRRNGRGMEPKGGESVILMDTFMAWESHSEPPSSRHQSDHSRESSIVPNRATDASFFSLRQVRFKRLVGGAAVAWGSRTSTSISPLFPIVRGGGGQ